MSEIVTASTTPQLDIAWETIKRARAHDDARHWIARWLVRGYLAILAVNVLVPLLLYVIARPKGITIGDFKDLVLTLGTITGGLAGVLGFVMGYYFKSEEGAGSIGNGTSDQHSEP